MNRIEELKELITKYDTAYRKGETLVSDSVYDELVDELVILIGEDDEFFESSIKQDINKDNPRRENVPIIMASTEKVDSIEEFHKWAKNKGISNNTEYIILPKFDGIALSKEEKVGKAWTKGRRTNDGLQCKTHLDYMEDVSIDVKYTYGEAIISKKNFNIILEKNLSDEKEKTARNTCSGYFRRDDVSENLKYVDFVRYGIVDDSKNFTTKKEIIYFLNNNQPIYVPYKINTIEEITHDYLVSLYEEFSKDYNIDGLIIEVNNLEYAKSLGRERNNNPKYLVAYKSKSFTEKKTSKIIFIEDNISKNGNIIPVAILEPVVLGGVCVSRATLNNYSYLRDIGAGIGATVIVGRNGDVVPGIIEVLDKKPFIMPNISCRWDVNGTHLKTTDETDEQKKKKLFAFFNILGVEGVSDKTFDLLFDSGFKTIKDILEMDKKDFENLERFGDTKAENVYKAIKDKTTNVSLSKLQHATGLFGSDISALGSKKLLLLEHFETKPTLEEIIKIDGFSDISAKNYLDGIDNFWEFIKDLPITWNRTKKVEAVSNKLQGKSFCFTGFRDKVSENEIVKCGGIITSGVSKKLNYLIIASKGSGSSKESKALDLGVIVLNKDELNDLLK